MKTMLILILIYVSFISLGLPDSLLGSGWPSMFAFLQVPIHYAGVISMTIGGGTVVSSLLSAKVIRRFGTGVVTASSVFMTAAALVGFSLSRNFLIICFCALPLGLGAGSVDAALNNYVALHYQAKHMSWLHCFWGVGASISPLIMSACLRGGHGWYLGYRTVGVIQLCLAAVLLLSLPLWRKNSGGPERGAAPPGTGALLRLRGLKQALGAFFFYCTVESTTGLWGASYLVTIRGIAPETAARWIALYYGGITAGRLVSGFLTLRLNNRGMIRLGQTVSVCGAAALFLPFSQTVLPGLFLIGLGLAPVFPSLTHETPDNFGAASSQAIMGMQMASAYVGTTLMPPLFGRAATLTGFAILPGFIAAALVIQIVLVERLHKNVRRSAVAH